MSAVDWKLDVNDKLDVCLAHQAMTVTYRFENSDDTWVNLLLGGVSIDGDTKYKLERGQTLDVGPGYSSIRIENVSGASSSGKYTIVG